MRTVVNRKLSNTVAQSAMLQFPGLFFMILYWIFTSDSDYYSANCVDLLLWSKVVLYLSTIGFFLSCVSIPLMYVAIFAFQSLLMFNVLAYFYLVFTLAYMLICLIVFSEICYSYNENENCGDLRGLNLAYIIVYAVIISLVTIWGCVVVICTMKHKKKKKKEEEKENYNEFAEE